MSETELFPVPEGLDQSAHCDDATYRAWYARSIEDPEGFWAEHGKRIDWIRPYSKVKDVSYAADDLHIRWFQDGTLNACANCVDRHLAERGDQIAVIWEGDDPAEDSTLTYRELHAAVSRFANGLLSLGAKKGDRITIYLPMIPEAAIAMLACARIGAVHSVVFGGFSPDSLAGRIQDCDSTLIVTADEGLRGGRSIPLKANTDAALESCPSIRKCVVVKRTGGEIGWVDGRDVWYHDLVADASADCPPTQMAAEDPLFILYTSGSTGKPKGVLHTTGGYMVYASMTHRYVFDYHDGETYWCTADVGWVTGHSYILYGPLANGATTLMFEGVPNYPDASRHWQVCDKHKRQHLLHRAHGDPRADAGGRGAGGEDVAGLAAAAGLSGRADQPRGLALVSPGGGRRPLPDRRYLVADRDRRHPDHAAAGGDGAQARLRHAALLRRATPDRRSGGERARGRLLRPATASRIPGRDRCARSTATTSASSTPTSRSIRAATSPATAARRDEDGYYWITGRVDDVLNVSGHRMGTAEVESALVAHPAVSESAVVGYPHDIKGQGIYAYVTLTAGREPSEELRGELSRWVRKEIGPIATPDLIQWAPGLPKTRSGKIMRRILRKIAANEHDALGDTSTLADPAVVEDLVDNRMNRA